jgi:pimeloyl-ACP methyl ester carboxylesterase
LLWKPDIHPEKEGDAVRVLYDCVIDEKRAGREIPCKIYVPVEAAHDPLPVIIWSHGLGGSRDGAAFLGRFIAARGYAVMHLTHDGTDTSIWEGKPGHPWDVIRATHISRKATLNRFRDVSAFLDGLLALENRQLLLMGRLKRESIGMSGHSFGALTTQVAAGQMLGRGERLYSLRDERIRCGIAYSLSTGYNAAGQTPDSLYGPIGIPMLYMTGTEDSSPISGAGYESRLPVYEAARGPDQHLLVLDGGDHMVFAGSRGKLGPNEKIRRHREMIQIISLAFWDAYLRADKNAGEWLTGEGLETYMGMDGDYKYKNES